MRHFCGGQTLCPERVRVGDCPAHDRSPAFAPTRTLGYGDWSTLNSGLLLFTVNVLVGVPLAHFLRYLRTWCLTRGSSVAK